MRFRLAAGLIVILAVALPSGAEPFDQFSVEKIKGSSCQIKPKGAKAWQAANEGEAHSTGSGGKTGSGSTITLAFDSKNRFRILPKTEVVIRSTTKDAKFRKVIELAMDEGEVEVDLEKLPNDYKFQVQTPTAVCGAVGTKFSVQSKDGRDNNFKSTKGTIFAASRQDGSFFAGSIKAGQSLEVDAAPGKENSYTKLKVTGGKLPVAFGAKGNQLEIEDGTVVSTAQQKTGSTDEVAMKVERGSVGGQGSGKYLVKDGKIDDVSGDEKSADLVDDYVALSQKEGALKNKLDQQTAEGAPPSKLKNLEKDLDAAAKEATAKRKELFQHRSTIRRSVRDGVDAIRNRPTRSPMSSPR